MQKDLLKNVLIAFLLGLSVFSVFRHLVVLREKIILADTLKQKQEELVSLQGELAQEKQTSQLLLQQKSGLRSYLEAARRKLSKLFVDIGKAKSQIRDLDGRIAILKTENQGLLDEKKRLSQENEEYKAKFSSVDELKKAIRDIKLQAHKPKIVEQKLVSREKVMIQGNQGFLVKDGKPTPPAKVVIEVTPALTKE